MRIKIWVFFCVLVALLTLCAPIVGAYLAPELLASASQTQAFAYSSGGPWSLGYDYLGRPVAAQLLLGGQTLLVAALVTAVVSQTLALATGLWMATRAPGSALVRFVFDVVLVLPMTVVSLIAYIWAGSSLWAVIPLATALTIPFSSRYFKSNAQGLLRSGFYEQARVAGDKAFIALFREVIPVLLRPIATEFGYAIISAIYILATVSFLGVASADSGFMWPTMVSQNLPGLALNPWAVLAPVLAIVLLSVPFNLLSDTLEGRSGLVASTASRRSWRRVLDKFRGRG